MDQYSNLILTGLVVLTLLAFLIGLGQMPPSKRAVIFSLHFLLIFSILWPSLAYLGDELRKSAFRILFPRDSEAYDTLGGTTLVLALYFLWQVAAFIFSIFVAFRFGRFRDRKYYSVLPLNSVPDISNESK